MKRWSRRRILVVVSLAAVVVWSIGCAWLLLQARAAADAGSEQLRSIRNQASISTFLEPSVREDLAAAGDELDRADDLLGHPALAPLKLVPVAGRHVRAVDRAVGAAAAVVDAAEVALRDLTELTERPLTDGSERVTLLRDLAAVAGEVEASLAAIDPGSADGLVTPLADAIVELEDQRSQAEDTAGKLQATSTAMAGLLEGPEPYLLLGANNAEMRNGSGMFLSAAQLELTDGRLDLGPVSPSAELVLPEGAVPVEGDLAENWPWLDPGRDLRNLGLTADFPQSAPIAAANWEATEVGDRVAGVLVLDVEAVRAMLRVVGPVEVDGVVYAADTVVGELLRQQYERFVDDTDARRDQLAEVTQAIFERLEAGEWEFDVLATELADAVQGRHLLVWSRDEASQEAWASVSADGHLDQDSLAVALLNRAGTKIDSWIDTDVTVDTGDTDDTDDTDDTEGEGRRLRLTYRITNRAPGVGPRYLVGPYVDGLAAGDHVGLVVANLPGGTTDVQLEGATTFLSGGDGPTVVIGGEATVRRGESVEVVVTARLPEDLDRLVVEPSARLPATTWTVDDAVVDGSRRRTILLGG